MADLLRSVGTLVAAGFRINRFFRRIADRAVLIGFCQISHLFLGICSPSSLLEQFEFNRIPGRTPYEKLKHLRERYNKCLKITECSKLWWDNELTKQWKVTRKSRKEKVTEVTTREERYEGWKKEQKKIRRLVKEKKMKCWQKFCKENEEKNPWEITKWAKDPWRLKGLMGKLTNQDRMELSTEKSKVQGLVKNNFGWIDNGRRVDK